MTNQYIGYKCACCGKEGVKLWKVYKYSAPELKCYECACVDLGVGQKEASTDD